MNAVAPEITLSPRQLAVCEFLCVALRCSGGGIRRRTGAGENTMAALHRLGIVKVRVVGRRGGIWTLTTLGRDTFCAQQEDDADSDRPESGQQAGPLRNKEVPPMSDTITDVKSDPKTTTAKKDPRRATPRGRKAATAASPAPPIEDVTDKKPVDSASLESALIAGIEASVGKLDKVEKQAYTRLMRDGKLVGYIRRSKKGVLVQLEARVDDEADVETAVAIIASALALS